MKKYLSISLAIVLVLVGFIVANNAGAVALISYVTTNPATSVTSTDATLNGTNENSDADGHSFWVSTSTFSTASPTIPDGVYSTPDFGAIASNTPFSASLSSITTSGVPTNLPAITPSTTYYFAAWSNVGGTWHPGDILTFTTDPAPVPDVTVTIIKYLDGVKATPENTSSSSFSMISTWSATNIGSGSGNFALDPNGFNSNSVSYEAVTSDMSSGADYSVVENDIPTSCNGDNTYALDGYKIGDSEEDAFAAATSTSASLTDITSNKVILVLNHTCSEATPPILTIVKQTFGGDGTFDFALTGVTSTSTSLTTSEGYATSSDIILNEGTSTVSELPNEGWSFTDVSCVYNNESLGIEVAGGEQIHVDNGDHVICTFTNTSINTGNIKVIKVVQDPSGATTTDSTTFTVNLNNGDTTSTSTVTDNSDADFTNLSEGTYTISEDTNENYDLISILPDNSDAGGAQVDVNNGTTTIVTIINRQHATSTGATVNIQKITNPGEYNQNFTFDLSQSENLVGTTTANANSGGGQITNIPAGSYDLTENQIPLWSLSGVSCQYENDQTGSNIYNNNDQLIGEHITLNDGDVLNCTFTNTAEGGGIRVVKNVVASDGSTKVTDGHLFSVTLNGTSTKEFSEDGDATYYNLEPGTYTVAENSDSSYDLVSISPDNDATTTDAQIDVQNGTTTVVTITNKQHASQTSSGGGASGRSGQHHDVTFGGGQVLGASIGPGSDLCPYLNVYLKFGANNDPNQVNRLKLFLNLLQNAGLTMNGIFDLPTLNAVKQFQLVYTDPIRQLWLDAGIPMPVWPTGYVYKTTEYEINKLICPGSNILPPKLP